MSGFYHRLTMVLMNASKMSCSPCRVGSWDRTEHRLIFRGIPFGPLAAKAGAKRNVSLFPTIAERP